MVVRCQRSRTATSTATLQATGGLVLFWSLKNPTDPERVIRTRQGVGTSELKPRVMVKFLPKAICFRLGCRRLSIADT